MNKHKKYTDKSGEVVYDEYTIAAGSYEAAIDAATLRQPLYNNGAGRKFCKVDSCDRVSARAWRVTLVTAWDV